MANEPLALTTNSYNVFASAARQTIPKPLPVVLAPRIAFAAIVTSPIAPGARVKLITFCSGRSMENTNEPDRTAAVASHAPEASTNKSRRRGLPEGSGVTGLDVVRDANPHAANPTTAAINKTLTRFFVESRAPA